MAASDGESMSLNSWNKLTSSASFMHRHEIIALCRTSRIFRTAHLEIVDTFAGLFEIFVKCISGGNLAREATEVSPFNLYFRQLQARIK